MRGADLAYTWRGPSTDPGVPGRQRTVQRAGQVQPCRSPDQVTVRPPRRRPHRTASPATSPSPRPPSASLPQARSCGTPRAAAVVDLDPDHAAGDPDRDRDRLPRSARAAVPDAVPEQLPSSAASSPHGCPGPGTPAVNARATRARSARPATVTLSRTTALATSAPAFPGLTRGPGNHPDRSRAHGGCTPGPAARAKPGTRRRRGPSVAVRETADGAHRPS